LNVILKAISELNPTQYNPRKDLQRGDPEYEKLKKSILEFDYIEPIIWNQRTGNVVGGHQRLKVLQELGREEVEVSVVDLPEDKEKALNLALNKISGDWDLPRLKELLEELNTGAFDIELTGFDTVEIGDIFEQFQPEAKEDNFDLEAAIESIVEPETNPGDIWQLGRHRIMCGDATAQADVDKLIDGSQASMVFTDPPYNVDYTGGTKDKLKIMNDKMSPDEFYKFLRASFLNMLRATEPGGAFYICHAESEGINFRTALADAGWLVKQCIIWVKNQFVIGRMDYQARHEPILYGWKPGAKHKWYGGRKQSTIIDESEGITVREDNEGKIITFSNGIETVSIRVADYEVLNQGDDSLTTIWRFDKPLRNAEHPTMKPIPLCARAIRNSSKREDIILDSFLGSGSTLIAAEQTGRICYGLELDPVYCDVIVHRWEEFTGQKGIKVNN